MWEKILLIIALHSGATFDAWTTNERFRAVPPGFRDGEMNPIVRPFLGKRSAYVALNLSVLPMDIWLISGKKPRAAKWTGRAWLGGQVYFSIDNMRRRNMWNETYRRHRAMLPKWDGVYRVCSGELVINAEGCPSDPGW